MDKFTIEIGKISEDGSYYEGTLTPDVSGLEQEPCVNEVADLSYTLRAEIIDKEILVRGHISMIAELVCARCAEIFSTSIEDSSFLRAYELKPSLFVLDMTPDLMESIALILPPNPLCSEGCKGLCSSCRKNLNDAQCDCEQDSGELCWSELDQLEIE